MRYALNTVQQAFRWVVVLGVVFSGLGLMGCDTVEPVEDAQLVVEGFLDAGKPLPPLRLRQTRPLTVPLLDDSTTAVVDAEVVVRVDDEPVIYRPAPGPPGLYEPQEGSLTVPPRSSFELEVAWKGQMASAAGRVPPPITIDSVQVTVPDAPVEAVVVDSLGGTTQQVFIYAIETTLWWTVDYPETDADSLYWVRAQLKPFTDFSSTVIDLFLRTEQIVREAEMARDAAGRRSWTGVYAVPVEGEQAPVPSHSLKVLLLRSGEDYAEFAASRDVPERREPVSNVTGGIGIFAGISLDSVRVQVE